MNADCHNTRGNFYFTLWWRKVNTRDEFMNDLRDRIGQVIHFYDSSGHKPRFSKIIPTEDDLPKPSDEGLLPHCSQDLSSESSPSIVTYRIYGCCFPSPYILGIIQLLQKGDQVQLSAHRTCSSEKRNSCVVRDSSVSIQYVFSWDESARDNVKKPGKWFPQILYSNHLYNTNKHITSDPEILIKYYQAK